MKKFFYAGLFLVSSFSSKAQIAVNEGFEGNAIPAGWQFNNFNQTSAAGFPCTGTGATRGNPYTFVPTPSIVYASGASNGAAINVSFKYNAQSNFGGPVTGQLKAAYSIDGGITYTNLGSSVTFTAAVTSCNTFTALIPSGTVPSGADFRLKIGAENSMSGDWYLTVDDVSIIQTATCYAPTNPLVSNIATNAASVNWTASTLTATPFYDVYYSTSATAPSATTTPSLSNIATTNTPLGSLLPNTTYYLWVRSHCSASDMSVWVPAAPFTTTCNPVSVFSENFDTYSTGNLLPDCWTRLTTGWTTLSISSNTPSTGTRNVEQTSFWSGDVNMAVMPPVNNINAGTHQLKFKVKVGSGTGELQVGYITDISNPSSFVNLQTLTITNTSYTAASAERTIVVPSTVPATARLAIKDPGTSFTSHYWDDVSWESISGCQAPSGLAVNTISNSAATISWSAALPNPANGYEYYYSTSSLAPGNTTLASGAVAAGVLSTPLTTLAANTTYYFWVRSVCGTGTYSPWSSVLSFYTGYCTPAASGAGTYIQSVSTVSWATDFSNLSTGFTAGGYADYSATYTGAMNAGSSKDLIINLNSTGSAGLSVYVDFNNNLLFESNELAYSSNGLLQAGPYTATISVPASTQPGTYRMRVITDFYSATPAACVITNNANGEAEDYTIQVLPVCAGFAVNLGNDVSICNGASQQLTAASPVAATFVWSNGATGNPITVNQPGTYHVTATSANGCVASDTVIVSLRPLPSATGIDVTGTSPTFRFIAAGYQDVNSFSWNFGDNSPTSNQLWPEHTYTNATGSDQTYTVTLIISNACGSDTITTTVTVAPTSIKKLSLRDDLLTVFPNPASDMIRIENRSGHKTECVRIFNVLGQQVMESKTNGAMSHSMNVGQLEPGMYFLEMQFEEGRVSRKLQILK